MCRDIWRRALTTSCTSPPGPAGHAETGAHERDEFDTGRGGGSLETWGIPGPTHHPVTARHHLVVPPRVTPCNNKNIEEGKRHKKRQRSSLLFGGKNLLNSLSR